jgi:hypothetical protein
MSFSSTKNFRKNGKQLVIPKKSDYNSPFSYDRPISGKIFESLTARRFSHAAYRCGAMSRTQLGGAQHNSAIDSLIFTTTLLSFAPKKPCGKDAESLKDLDPP